MKIKTTAQHKSVGNILNRRKSREVFVGKVAVGANNPIRIQSMLTSDTMDTDLCVRETLELVKVGCEIVRITAPTKKHAFNLKNIISELRNNNCDVPIVADLHFRPDAALEAAKWVDKIRINPGNYADKKIFKIKEYSDQEYQNELDRIRDKFSPLVEICKNRDIAMRIGTNHGSLSDRIMNRYGDTPMGMVESALEFMRISRDMDYHNLIFSMKASNPKVMISAYRLLVMKLENEGNDCNYPIHLGVTEAGDGEDGRIKSSVGIGTLLNDGIGDTIRVSLTEDSVNEIPVAREIVNVSNSNYDFYKKNYESIVSHGESFDYRRRISDKFEIQGVTIGESEPIRVAVYENQWISLKNSLNKLGECQPEIVLADDNYVLVGIENDQEINNLNSESESKLVGIDFSKKEPGEKINFINEYRNLSKLLKKQHNILLTHNLDNSVISLESMLSISTQFGSLICDGIGDVIALKDCSSDLKPNDDKNDKNSSENFRNSKHILLFLYNILQSSGARFFKTDYVACPSCGRTLFDLQTTTEKVRSATNHLKGVRIAIMGCIVNGPGEMADADFGYVGGAPGKINLYVGKTPVKTGIPQDEAVERLIDLIKEHDRWIEKPELIES